MNLPNQQLNSKNKRIGKEKDKRKADIKVEIHIVILIVMTEVAEDEVANPICKRKDSLSIR